MNKNVVIIGSGFSSLSASCYLAKAGYEVTIYEKNDVIGGRASQLTKDGFTFDMGPSWYWMPDIFDSFFKDFGKKTSDYYTLDKLSPAYKIFFSDDVITIGDSLDKISKEFERIEKEVPPSSENLFQRPKKTTILPLTRLYLDLDYHLLNWLPKRPY